MRRAVEPARKLRRDQTEAEMKLWFRLRNRRLGGLKFRRQVPVAGFIADFLCQDARLIVEVDGGQHGEQVTSDAERTEILKNRGFEVLRFWNNEVLNDIEAVLECIVEKASVTKANASTPHPDPLPMGEGELGVGCAKVEARP
jgi:very-short-patch-repair endonuclease